MESDQKKQKLYAYVDESGQDTKGEIFIVSVVVTGEDRDQARKMLEEVERLSRKRDKKWTKARPKERRAYFELLMQSPFFRDRLYFASYRHTTNFIELTIVSTAKVILEKASESPYSATVLVDGLGKTERYRFASGLRKLQVHVHKVRGIRDESDALIRLADAVAGLVRDSVDGRQEMQALLRTAQNLKLIQQM